VGHRKVILPQLAASGIETKKIQKKTGWEVIWGPVYAEDIQAFVENGLKKTKEMREVKFPLVQRLEMALMWSFPFSLIASLITIFIWPEILLPLNGFIWGLPFLVFASFPLYSRWLSREKKSVGFSKYTVIFDFGRMPLILFGIVILFLVGLSLLTHTFTGTFALRWGFISFIIILIISLDLMGSTPIYKSCLHEDRFLKIVLDEQRCQTAGFCEQVCPRNCYKVDAKRHVATLPRAERCVQCGACVVQCPFDALYFMSPEGETVPPATIRAFKLNLLGKRFKK
jgi:NAD-dependent dihydropyrimidine dehydrogenase PreA subunit